MDESNPEHIGHVPRGQDRSHTDGKGKYSPRLKRDLSTSPVDFRQSELHKLLYMSYVGDFYTGHLMEPNFCNGPSLLHVFFCADLFWAANKVQKPLADNLFVCQSFKQVRKNPAYGRCVRSDINFSFNLLTKKEKVTD